MVDIHERLEAEKARLEEEAAAQASERVEQERRAWLQFRLGYSRNGLGIEELFDREHEASRALHGFVLSNRRVNRPTRDFSRRMNVTEESKKRLEWLGEKVSRFKSQITIPVTGWKLQYGSSDFNFPLFIVVSERATLHSSIHYHYSVKGPSPDSVGFSSLRSGIWIVESVVRDLTAEGIPFVDPLYDR